MDNSERPTPAVQSQTATVSCSTCAAQERNLQAIQTLPQFLYICTSFSVSMDAMICFECCAILSKFVKFQLRAMKAKTVLDCASKLHNYVKLQGLSTLTHTAIQQNSTVFNVSTTLQHQALKPRTNAADTETEAKGDIGMFLDTVGKGVFLETEDKRVFLDIGDKVETEETGELLDMKAFEDETLFYKDEEMLEEMSEPEIEIPRAEGEDMGEEEEKPKAKKKRIRKKTPYVPRAKKKLCKKCNRLFRCDAELRRHIEMNHTVVPLVECPMCHKEYKGEPNLKNHIRTVHEESKPRDENAYCPECDVQFSSIALLQNHLRNAQKHVGPAPIRFECHDCGKMYKNKKGIRTHMENKHLQLSCYKCDTCLLTLPSCRALSDHKRVQHSDRPQRPYACRICKKNYTHRRTRDDHQNMHFGHKPYICEECGVGYAYASNLYYHKQVYHLNKKPKKPTASVKKPAAKREAKKRTRVKKSAVKKEEQLEIVETSWVDNMSGDDFIYEMPVPIILRGGKRPPTKRETAYLLSST